MSCKRLTGHQASIKLNQTAVEIYSRQCRANLGDERCGISRDLYSKDTYCDKRFITCCNKFNNAVNFRGEPFIPNGPL